LKFAVDTSNWTGEIPLESAKCMKDSGFSLAIINLYNAHFARQQYDSYKSAGLKVHAYIYFEFDLDPLVQLETQLAHLEGRVIDMLWIDCEDDDASNLTEQQTIDYIWKIARACEGRVNTGIYTRSGWWLYQTGNTRVFADAGFKLWDATNDRTANLSFNPYGGWDNSFMEQYLFDAQLCGETVDLNVYRDEPVELPDMGEVPQMVGTVRPVVIHFGATEEQVARMLKGYNKAMFDAQAWFYKRLDGNTFNYAPAQVIDAHKYNRTLAQVKKDAWGQSLGIATEAGYPVWENNNLVAILVDKIPHNQPGLGGASPSPRTGATVKDGDALEVFAAYHSGESTDRKLYEQNVAMLIHELLHAMHANDHEDVSGPNVEHEWWEGLVVDLAPVNRPKLLASVWLEPLKVEEPETPPAPVVNVHELIALLERAKVGMADAEDAVNDALDQLQRLKP
jgi:hypothetical protein